MTTAAARAMGKRLPAIRKLAKQACGQFPTRPGFESLFAFVNRNLSVDWIDDGNDSYPIHTVFAPPAEMRIPPAALASLKLPAFPTTAALAGWLGVTPGRLDWLADPSGRNRLHRAGPLRTYRYRWAPKPGRRWRLLEIPTPLLKRLQRRLLEGLLSLVPAHVRPRVPTRPLRDHQRRRTAAAKSSSRSTSSISSSRSARHGSTRCSPRSAIPARSRDGSRASARPDYQPMCGTGVPIRLSTARISRSDGATTRGTCRKARRPHLLLPTSLRTDSIAVSRGSPQSLARPTRGYADDLTFSGGARSGSLCEAVRAPRRRDCARRRIHLELSQDARAAPRRAAIGDRRRGQ